MTSAKAVREWIGLSLSEMATELDRLIEGNPTPGGPPARSAGHGQANRFNKQKVDRWEKTGRMPLKVRRAYGKLLANDLSELLDRTIGVSIKANSPWHVQAHAECACKSWYKLRRADQQRCSKCAKGRKRK